MKTQNIFLEFLSEYNAWGVADDVVENISKNDIVPIIKLADEDYKKLIGSTPSDDAPVVAFLLGREKGYYTIDFNYAKAIAQSNVNIRFLTYNENILQMNDVDGLILPGGAFDSPNEFYTDPMKQTDNAPSNRSFAYITSIIEAEKNNIPMLGICAGAQMIAGVHGMKLYRSIKEYTNSKTEHKTKELNAHNVNINPNSPLFEIIKQKQIMTNSRHNEAVVNDASFSDLKIYAACDDEIPEAWGNDDLGILCIQWHPEDFAAKGDEISQNIYNTLANKARDYKKKKNEKLKRESFVKAIIG